MTMKVVSPEQLAHRGWMLRVLCSWASTLFCTHLTVLSPNSVSV